MEEVNCQGNDEGEGGLHRKGGDTRANPEWQSEMIHRITGSHVSFIFYIKIYFSIKAWMVSNGAMTEAPLSQTYYSVISRDSVFFALLIAKLNDLDIIVCDVGNAYLNAPCQEEIWFAAGPDQGPEKTGKVMVMVRYLYGLNSGGVAWRKIFAEILHDMYFVPMVADSDVYHRWSRKPNGEE